MYFRSFYKIINNECSTDWEVGQLLEHEILLSVSVYTACRPSRVFAKEQDTVPMLTWREFVEKKSGCPVL